MPEATDLQMQNYMNQRVRVHAESFRSIYLAVKDDKAAMQDEYDRAIGTNRWNDANDGGPPHLLQSGNSASPDDLLNFNQFITAFITIIDGTGESDAVKAGYVNDMRNAWAVFQRACARPV